MSVMTAQIALTPFFQQFVQADNKIHIMLWTVNCPHKGPAMWKMFPCHNVIMPYLCDLFSDSLLSPLDPPEHLFRIRLACVLLETCGQYFDRGSSKKKLDCFLVYFQVSDDSLTLWGWDKMATIVVYDILKFIYLYENSCFWFCSFLIEVCSQGSNSQ